MEINVILLSALRYDNKNGKGTRIAYVLADKTAITDTDNMRGYQEYSFFTKYEFFEKLPLDKMGKQCTLKIEDIPSTKNPLKRVSRVVQIDNISLV